MTNNLKLWFDWNFNSTYINFFKLPNLNIKNNEIGDLLNAINTESTLSDNLTSLYHYSIPNIKLYYPEPFIATPTFLHYDMWFIHISIYQHWLWFFFIFIIIFFTITFISTLRWCNIRIRPRRETRGVSRSKCGDLITATIPVTWAASIIIHESTDSIEYYDGFGTTEMAVGVRAYQWGWEYYYPKDIDLNYKVKGNNSHFVGNSLYYNNTSADFSSSFNYWNYHKNKDFFDGSVTPAHLMLTSVGSDDIFGFWNLKNFGFSKLLIRNAFKNILNTRYVSFSNNLNYSIFSKNFYQNDLKNKFNYSTELGNYNSPVMNKNQLMYLSSSSIFNSSANYSNLKSLDKFLLNNSDSLTIGNMSGTNTSAEFKNILDVNNQYSSNKNLFLFNNLLKSNKFDFINRESDSIGVNNSSNFFFYSDYYKNYLSSNVCLIDEAIFDKNYAKIGLDNAFSKFLYQSFDGSKSSNQIDKTQQTGKGFAFNSLNTNILIQNGDLNNDNLNFKSLKNLNTMSLLANNSANLNLQKTNLSFLKNLNYSAAYPILESSPLKTNNPFYLKNTVDSLNILKKEDTLEFLNNPMDSDTNFFYSKFISQNLKNSGRSLRLMQLNDINNTSFLNKWPNSYMYADIDFKRIAGHDMLEDLFWESNMSYDTVNTYSNFKNRTTGNISWNYQYKGNFGYVDRGFNYNYNNKTEPFFKNLNNLNPNYPLELSNNKGSLNYSYLLRKDFLYYPNIVQFYEFLDNSFVNFKQSFKVFNNLNLNILLLKTNYLYPVSDLYAINQNFSDYEHSYFSSNNSNFKLFGNLNLSSIDMSGLDFSNITKVVGNVDYFNNLNSYNLKISSNNSLLSSFKNLTISYGAIWKIYRSSFDEGRSNTYFKDFSKSYNKVPFITTELPNFKRLLHKNSLNYVNPLLYFDKSSTLLNDLFFMNNSINYFTYEFPFFTSIENDSIRYSWFDWYSNNSKRVTKSLDTTQYNLNGSKIYSNKFDYLSTNIDDVTSSENYLTKLTHARKIHLPSWTYSLFFLSKMKHWYNMNSLVELTNKFSINTSKLYFLFNYMDWYKKSLIIYPLNTYLYINGFSNILVPTRNYWRCTNSYSSYSYYVTSLLDILFKREYLIRQLFSVNKSFINLPKTFTAYPSNPILLDFKSSIIYNTNVENQTENYKLKSLFFLKNLNFEYLNNYNLSIFNNLFKYFNANYNKSSDLFYKKSQYKHMRKSISNMIRIQADKAVAMPVDTRIQLLTVSKDIIHSWAIPSAGIKIDCIPGYSSHKVTIFFLSGVYWGQCMEICGRFHHWMPIVVYFMKRDLFILWCVHFIFENNQLNKVNQHSDKISADFLPLISFDNSSWLLELNNK